MTTSPWETLNVSFDKIMGIIINKVQTQFLCFGWYKKYNIQDEVESTLDQIEVNTGNSTKMESLV